MLDVDFEVLISEALWFFVVVGWIVLIMIGLEADKPLSGGLPSHTETVDEHTTVKMTGMDRLGILAAWTLFGGMAISLPFILWWIFMVHGR